MITVWFVPGMFGSTIEYVLRNFSGHYDSAESRVLEDGSLHGLNKMAHLAITKDLDQFVLDKQHHSGTIATVMYPFSDQSFVQLRDRLSFANTDKNIFVYSHCTRDSELNLLFQYYKIANGTSMKKGKSIFQGNNPDDFRQWNAAYNSVDDLKPWEWREWFSIFYEKYVQEWQDTSEVPDNWLKITNCELLYKPTDAWLDILEYTNSATPVAELLKFGREWYNKQRYVVEEFRTIDSILLAMREDLEFKWQPLSPVGEAIVQKRLRDIGVELKCDGLDEFPTQTQDLQKVTKHVKLIL